MFGIGHLLNKFQSRQGRKLVLIEAIRVAVKEIASCEVWVEDIKISGSTVILSGLSATARSEIFIKKAQILKLINSRQDSLKVTDLR